MERNKINLYDLINNEKDINSLFDLFYEQVNTKEAFDSLPVCIRIYDRVKDINPEEAVLLSIELRNLYIFVMSKINELIYKSKYESDTTLLPDEIDNMYHLGFNIILSKVYDRKALNFITKNMLNDMFNNRFPNHDINIEDDIHRSFSSKDKIEKNGIDKSFIDVIRNHDPHLANYITCNSDLLKGVKEKDDIINNYDCYEDKNEENKFKFIISDISEFCKEKEMDEEETLLRLAAEYHFIDKIIKYDDRYKDYSYVSIKDIVISASRNEISFDYIKLRKIVERYLNERVVTKRLSESDLLKNKLDEYIKNNDLEELRNIFTNIKNNKDFDFAIMYLAKNTNSNSKNILRFIKKEIN